MRGRGWPPLRRRWRWLSWRRRSYGTAVNESSTGGQCAASRRSLRRMGQPVVHFEIIGRDGERLQSYYSELFGWEIDSDNEMGYGLVQREGNTNAEGVGIGGGVGRGPEGYDGHVTIYIEVPDGEAALAKADQLGGSRMMGPAGMQPGLVIGMFADPGGHVV